MMTSVDFSTPPIYNDHTLFNIASVSDQNHQQHRRPQKIVADMNETLYYPKPTKSRLPQIFGTDLMNQSESCHVASQASSSDTDKCILQTKARSVRHFQKDANSDRLAFSDVYVLWMSLDLSDKYGKDEESNNTDGIKNIPIYFMLRECPTPSIDSVFSYIQPSKGQFNVVFDVANSSHVYSKKKRQLQEDSRDSSSMVDLYTKAETLYGPFFGPVGECFTLHLDKSFPHSRFAPRFMDVRLDSLIKNHPRAKTAIQSGQIYGVYKHRQAYREHKRTLPQNDMYLTRYSEMLARKENEM